MIQFKALLLKELKEAFRDKRALMVALSMGFLMPVVIVAMSKFMIKQAVETPAMYVKFTGAQYAPKMVKQLKDANILAFTDVPESDKKLWDERSVEVVIPETFSADMQSGKQINVILRADYSEKSLAAPLRRIEREIRNYSRSIGYKRLLVRGIDVKLLNPIQLMEQDTSQPSSNAMIISLMLGLYLLMGAFVSGQSIAVDASAGERERNVLEMLLCQPVKTQNIVLAKLISSALIATLSISIMLSLTTIAVGFVDLSKIGASFSLDLPTIGALMVSLVPLCFLAAALQLFVGFQAKTFKEAQSTVAMLVMVPTMIPLALMFMESKPDWIEWVPVSGQSLIMEELFKGLPIEWAALGATTLLTMVVIAVLVFAMAKRLQSEKVIQSLS